MTPAPRTITETQCARISAGRCPQCGEAVTKGWWCRIAGYRIQYADSAPDAIPGPVEGNGGW